MTTEPEADRLCAACGTQRVNGRCPGCREAVARAINAIDQRKAATTPEPGQRVWIEATAFEYLGEIRLSLSTAATAIWQPLASDVVWHPADDPRQSLGHGTIADAFAGLDALSEALRMAASPLYATQDDPQPPDTADNTTSPRDAPGATQGAGRDWAGEINNVLTSRVIEVFSYEGRIELADVIVAALGLHNLEQTIAAQGDEIDAADAECAKLLRRLNVRFDEVVKARAERDAARRELQQLRDEVKRLIDFWGANDDLMDYEFRTALAGGTPATHNEPVAKRCKASDHDLFTNKRLRCDKPTGHDGIHKLVFEEHA